MPFALVRRDLVTREAASIASSPTSCVRVVILPGEMELAGNPSTERSELGNAYS